jgi:DNA repair protein RecO (recombination protein O)
LKSNQNQSDAFLLHATKFKESSLLCVFFSKDFGKVSAVAKGARSKKSKFQVLTVPGAIFKISFSGKNDLKTLTSCESTETIDIKGPNFKIYLYLNEIILKLLESYESMPHVYENLVNIFKFLDGHKNESIEFELRQFEYMLISELGYGFNIDKDVEGRNIDFKSKYSFNPQLGFSKGEKGQKILGQHIINFLKNNFKDPETRFSIKMIMRAAIENIIEKPLSSREVFK